MHQVYKDALVRIESGRSRGMCAAVSDSTDYRHQMLLIPEELHKHDPRFPKWVETLYRTIFGRGSWPYAYWYPLHGPLGAWGKRKRIAILKKCIEETTPTKNH